jgi:hypothetical protein
MRFQRRDIPGLLVAIGGSLALFFLVLEAYQLWGHHGSPLLGIISVHIAIGGGLIGAFWRFVKNKDAIIGVALALALAVIGVLVLQATDSDGTALATTLKLAGVVLFLVLNVLVVWQILSHGLNPILQRRDDRRAEAEAAE